MDFCLIVVHHYANILLLCLIAVFCLYKLQLSGTYYLPTDQAGIR